MILELYLGNMFSFRGEESLDLQADRIKTQKALEPFYGRHNTKSNNLNPARGAEEVML
jgi:hypothetical protein